MEKHTRIPADRRVETLRATTRVVAYGDIIQTGKSLLVQPRIQETKGRLAGIDPCVVEHRNEGGEGGSRAGRARDGLDLSLIDDEEVPSLRRNIGDALYRSNYRTN